MADQKTEGKNNTDRVLLIDLKNKKVLAEYMQLVMGKGKQQ